MRTGKRIDDRPVCVICMLADARANDGRVPDYCGLTPIGIKAASIQRSEVTEDMVKATKKKTEPKTKRAAREKKPNPPHRPVREAVAENINRA